MTVTFNEERKLYTAVNDCGTATHVVQGFDRMEVIEMALRNIMEPDLLAELYDHPKD